jgi:hypothetical protein
MLLGFFYVHAPAHQGPILLGGEWRFAMDRKDSGIEEKWFARDLSDRIKLPGILQSRGYGDEISVDTPWVAALPRDMQWYRLPQYPHGDLRASTINGQDVLSYVSWHYKPLSQLQSYLNKL